MKTNTIKPPSFKGSIARIIADIRKRTCTDDADVEIIEEILRVEIKDYYDLIDLYYEEEYCVAVASASNSAYDNGYADGFADGYDEGCYESHSENNS